jgi:hypothetical protein
MKADAAGRGGFPMEVSRAMSLSKDQSQFYRQTLDMTRKQINDLNVQIEEELSKVKERLAELQNSKNAAKQIYDGVCKILGVENDLEKEETTED